LTTRKITSKPGKQRKAVWNASGSRARKLLSAPLSSGLETRHGIKSLPVRKGDTVKIVRGDFTGIEGKVTEVDRGRKRLFVEGVTRDKVSGTQTKMSVHASKVQLTNLVLDDRWRSKSIEERKGSSEPESETKEEKKETN
jgi:large subunit ribosomal protein L24